MRRNRQIRRGCCLMGASAEELASRSDELNRLISGFKTLTPGEIEEAEGN